VEDELAPLRTGKTGINRPTKKRDVPSWRGSERQHPPLQVTGRTGTVPSERRWRSFNRREARAAPFRRPAERRSWSFENLVQTRYEASDRCNRLSPARAEGSGGGSLPSGKGRLHRFISRCPLPPGFADVPTSRARKRIGDTLITTLDKQSPPSQDLHRICLGRLPPGRGLDRSCFD
jgi:hypothetical protein